MHKKGKVMRKRVGIIFSSLVLLMAFSMITPAATFRQVQILSKGASSYTKPYSQYTTVTYAVKIKNPNKDYAIRFPSIDVTLYGSGGRIVDTDSMSAWFIPANETMYLTGETLVEKSRGSVSRVTFNVEQKNEYSFEKQNNYKHIRLSKYKISNVSQYTGNLYTTYTGRLTNTSGYKPASEPIINVIFTKNGKIIGGDRSVSLPASGSGDFKVLVDTEMINSIGATKYFITVRY